MIVFRLFCCLTVLLGTALLPASLQAAIVDSGDVQPDISQWTSLTTAYIGLTSEGSVSVGAGSLLTSNNGYLGYQAAATGTVTVAGAGSAWTNNSTIHVGDSGTGTLLIEAGGHVNAANSYLGNSFYSNGAATVTGAGSQWSNTNSFYVGNFGNGTLSVEAGGQVSNTTGYVGYWSIAGGVATVTGAGSEWTSSGELYVGDQGSATLSITGGGLVTVGGTLRIDNDLDGDGFVNMATGGMLALAGDADASLAQFLGLVSGTDAIRFWNAALLDWSPLTSASSGDDYTLTYHSAGDLAGYTVLTVGRVGDFDNDGDIDGRDFLAWQRNPELGSLSDWQNIYGTDSLAAAIAVPEPGGLVLLLAFVLLRPRAISY